MRYYSSTPRGNVRRKFHEDLLGQISEQNTKKVKLNIHDLQPENKTTSHMTNKNVSAMQFKNLVAGATKPFHAGNNLSGGGDGTCSSPT